MFLHLEGQRCGVCHYENQPITFLTVLFFEVVLSRSSTSVTTVASKGGPGSTGQWFSGMRENWMLTVPNWFYSTSFLHGPHLHNWIMKHLGAKESYCKRPPELRFCLASLLLFLSPFSISEISCGWEWYFPKRSLEVQYQEYHSLFPYFPFFACQWFFLFISSFSILAFSTHPLKRKRLSILPFAKQANILLG